MTDDYTPRHRKHAVTKTRPRLQRAPRHRGPEVLVDSAGTRYVVTDESKPQVFSIRDLMRAHVDAFAEGRRLFGPER